MQKTDYHIQQTGEQHAHGTALLFTESHRKSGGKRRKYQHYRQLKHGRQRQGCGIFEIVSVQSVISQNPKDRSSLSVFRSMGGMFAGILISVVAPLVIYYEDAAGNQVVNPTNFTVLAGGVLADRDRAVVFLK